MDFIGAWVNGKLRQQLGVMWDLRLEWRGVLAVSSAPRNSKGLFGGEELLGGFGSFRIVGLGLGFCEKQTGDYFGGVELGSLDWKVVKA